MKRRYWLRAIAIAGCVLPFASATPRLANAQPAATFAFESGTAQVGVIELYTSEGCHSCPRADRWLSQLKNDSRLWREWVPVAFHVDYWNYLGWPDRFADSRYSYRQRAYHQAGHLKSVYTPGLVVNGAEWRGFFWGRPLPSTPDQQPGQLRLTGSPASVTAAFYPPPLAASPSPERYRLHLTLLGFELSTAVQAGENRGKQLAHDFVVLGYKSLPLAASAAHGGYRLKTVLPSSQEAAPRYGVAAWVTRHGEMAPLQAVGGWLQ